MEHKFSLRRDARLNLLLQIVRASRMCLPSSWLRIETGKSSNQKCAAKQMLVDLCSCKHVQKTAFSF